ncbi:NRAMP family divalent metal transporter [Ferrimonas senticii]|uniref:NRAMP family divalent metal transporter n=1 Tax=Ferrimonas senticii TaxID=394566 RepID=UPI000489AB1E|nr:divalent metal cation transporter [Ferrimonas senticii]
MQRDVTLVLDNPSSSLKQRVIKLYQLLGPGIMLAAAAVGGSHLVASTQAGALYGWQLVGLILLVNLLKYPFFRAGVQYTMGTGKTLIEGYAEMGRPYLLVFAVLAAFSAVVNVAALLLFSASLWLLFVPTSWAGLPWALLIMAACLAILIGGHYRLLDSLSKWLMLALTIATCSAVAIAAGAPSITDPNFVSPSPWTLASLGFLVATMGWMPAPIDIAAINTLWLQRHCKTTEVNFKQALLDFNVGYIGTAVLAVVFVALGALVMHGTGVVLEKSGTGFTHQLVSMFTSVIGDWAHYLISTVAFLTIFGSTITALDGYSRAVAESHRLLCDQGVNYDPQTNARHYSKWLLAVGLGSVAIVVSFSSSLLGMLNFAMVAAFTTTPVFALLNYLLVSDARLPAQYHSPTWVKLLSKLGLVALFGFLALFIWWKFFYL